MPKALADPPGAWQRVDSRLTLARELASGLLCLALTAVACVPLVLALTGTWPDYPLPLAAGLPTLFVACAAVRACVIPFQVRNTRYALREDDLAVARGVLNHRSEVIPYGRLQYVDVTAGPLLRALGLCELQVHTASPDAHPRIPGLPRAVGEELRDELARRGEQRLAGL